MDNSNVNMNSKIKKIGASYVYNLLNQLFALITPIVTTPYVARVLLSDGVGRYSFSYSIVSIFVLFSALGFGIYAQREIARFQNNIKEQSIIFWEVFFLRLIPVVFTCGFYIIFIDFSKFCSGYFDLLIIMLINIITTAFDINYFYQGNEEFKLIAIRNIVIKIFGTLAIFVFVKAKTDVWIYTLVQSLILLISNLSLWITLPKRIVRVSLAELNIKRHLIPTLRLFLPTITVSIYTILDKALIGLLIQGNTTIIVNGQSMIVKLADLENGYYEQSEKLIKMAMTVITSLGTIMAPRNANEIAKGNTNGFIKNIRLSLRFSWFLAFPMAAGFAAIAYNLSPWFFGEGYDKVPLLIVMFSPLIIIIGTNNVLGIQALIPVGKEKYYTIAITMGAITNIILNFFLIKRYWSYGACIATLSAELMVDMCLFYFSKDFIKISFVFEKTWKYIISSILMGIIVFRTSLILSPSVMNTLLLIIEGILFYGISLLLLRDEIVVKALRKLCKK